MGKIIYLMGKSSAGKDTIYRELLKTEDIMLNPVILYTTRPMREEEKQGREYFFVDNLRLDTFQREDKLIELREYHTIHGIWKYATVDDGQIKLEKGNYIMIGTLESFEKMKQYFGSDSIIPIYIVLDDGLRLMRAIQRERRQEFPRYEELCRRFLADAEDFSKEKLQKSGVSRYFINNDLESCIVDIVNEINNFT